MAQTLPQTQKAAVLKDAYGRPHTIDTAWEVKPPGVGEAVVRVEAASLCFGDVLSRDGHSPAPKDPVRPMITGHEGIGHIIALGEHSEGFRVGDRVGMGWRNATCMQCKYCQSGRDNLCLTQKTNGIEVDGTFREYMTTPTRGLIPVNTTLRAAQLAPLMCAGGTAIGGIRSAKLSAGDWICITGAAGGVGSLACMYAKHMKYRVVAIDSKMKEEACRKLGVDAFVNYEDSKSLVGLVNEYTKGGVQGTLVCTPNPQAYEQAFRYSAPGATIVCIGPAMLHFHGGQLIGRGISLVGQHNGSRKDIEDALQLSAEGILPEVDIISLESLDEAMDEMVKGRSDRRRVVEFPV